MEPNIWGPDAWTFLHSITFQYPENPTDIDKQNYHTFFDSLKNVLPCPTCQEHYGNTLTGYPIKLDNRQELIEWFIDIHNDVNRNTGKEVYSYDDVYRKYNVMYGVDTGNNYEYLLILLILSIIIIGCYYYKEIYLKKH